MQILVLFLVFFGVVTLQLTVVPLLAIKSIPPDLTLIFVVSVAVQKGRVSGVMFGFGAGIINDLFSTDLLGATALANSIAAYIAGFVGREQLERQTLSIFLVLTISVLCRDFILNFLMAVGTELSFWRILFSKVLPHSLYSVILAILLHTIKPELIRGPKPEVW